MPGGHRGTKDELPSAAPQWEQWEHWELELAQQQHPSTLLSQQLEVSRGSLVYDSRAPPARNGNRELEEHDGEGQGLRPQGSQKRRCVSVGTSEQQAVTTEADPVTTVCGHSYCMSCINTHWDKGEERGGYSCPQCRQTFTPRPVLGKNTMLADLVEELKKTGLQAAPADHCYSGPEDVACDPHLQSAPFKKHKLVEPSEKLQENICSRHDEVMKMFCRTDQQCICYLCSVDEHKGHDTVTAAAERTERQRELGLRRQTIQQSLQDTEKDVKLLQQEEKAINGSADKAVQDSEEIFTELIRVLEKRSSDVKQQIRSQQQTEVSRVRELQERLEQEITELKRKDRELKQLSDTEDHNQFLHNYPSLSPFSGSTHSSSIRIRPLRYFEDVTAAVSQVRGRLKDILSETETEILWIVSQVDVLLPRPETRADF
ncbi:unnamed protein product [Pleuronectes platessa]|uniref:Uncharacterized protein n=1 Tax=Pleuronectes platessa TaxID=8262 RepID=A0A9N7V9T0_PLEPL|nr:unnamed protein product [Pleuronectes platessa]